MPRVPSQIVRTAAALLILQMRNGFFDAARRVIDDAENEWNDVQSLKDKPRAERLRMSVFQLSITYRLASMLEAQGITTIREAILAIEGGTLPAVEGFGEKYTTEVIRAIRAIGLKVCTEIDTQPLYQRRNRRA